MFVFSLLFVQGFPSAYSATLLSNTDNTPANGGQQTRLSPDAKDRITTATTTVDINQCQVFNKDEFLYNKIREQLEWKTKLINYNVSFVNYTTNPLLENTTSNYKVWTNWF